MQKRVSHIVFFFPTQDANSILKGSEWCWWLWYITIWTHCSVLQIVSDIASFVQSGCNHIVSYENRRLAAQSHAGLMVQRWCNQNLPMANSMWARLQLFLRTSFMHFYSHRMWVTLKILWKVVQVLSHLFLWPTGSEWCCIFCEGNLITSFPMTNSLWVTLHILWKAISSHL